MQRYLPPQHSLKSQKRGTETGSCPYADQLFLAAATPVNFRSGAHCLEVLLRGLARRGPGRDGAREWET